MNNKRGRISMIFGIIILFIIFISFVSVDSAPAKAKIDVKVYNELKESKEARVVVKLNVKQKKPEIEKIKKEIIKDIGENKVRHIFSEEIAVEISEEELDELNKNPNVESIIIDKKIFAFLQESVSHVNASKVWPIQLSGQNITGVDETICILDTGINFTHPDLIDKNKTCIIDCRVYPATSGCIENCSVHDDNGHGTHVAGIAAASGGINGVGANISLIGVKVLDSNGSGYGTDLNAGLDWCISNADTYNISVISMSLGDCTNHSSYCNDDSSASRINNATGNNISVIVAAGNGPSASCSGITNINGPSAPACVENATAVGGVDDSDNIQYQRGALFQLLAPSANINSTFAGGSCLSGCTCAGNYMQCGGTSMATPHVSGAVALIKQFFRLQNNRVPTPSEIKSALNTTGKTIDDSAGSGYNFQRIDIFAAIVSLDTQAPTSTLVSPADNHLNSTLDQTFKCNATDGIGLSNITLEIWDSQGDLYYNYTNSTSGIASEGVFNATLANGNYKWNCLVNDMNNNSAYASSNFSLYIGNLSVSLISPSNNTYTNANQTNFTCLSQTANIFDLDNVTFYLWNSTGLINNSNQTISGTSNSTSFEYNLTIEDTYTWNCLAENNDSQSAFADSNYTIIFDASNPIISSVSSSPSTTSATITWTTNESCNSSVNYGTTTALGSNTSSSNLTTSHSVSLSSLSSSTTYYYNVTSCDAAENCVTNGSYSFTTSSSGNGGNGGGGGGGGVAITSTKTYEPTLEETSSPVGYTQILSTKDKIKFTFFDETAAEHILTVNEIGENYVNLIIQSSTINLKLGIGQSAKLNLTSPDYYDLYVKLNSIENKKASLTIQTINEEIPKPSITGEVVKEKEEEEEKPEKEEKSSNIMNYIKDILIIILIIAVLVILFSKRGKKRESRIAEYRKRFKSLKPKK